MKLGAILAAALAALLGTTAAHAQPATQSAADYPSKPIRIIGGFAAGGTGGNIMVRMISDWLGRKWNQSIVVENMPGGGSLIGTQYVKRAAPDGYTLLFGFDSLAMFNIFLKNPDIDVQRDLTPISYFSHYPLMVIASAGQPYKTMPEFVAYAKANPGKINFAMQPNTPSHLFSALLANRLGVDWQMIPYTGSAPMNLSMLTGETHVTLAPYGTRAADIKEGKLIPLAILDERRSALAPDVPSLKEQGTDIAALNWYGLFGPAGLPKPITDKLSAAIQEMVKDPAVIDQANKMSLDLIGSTPEFMAKTLATDLKVRAEAGKIAKIQPE